MSGLSIAMCWQQFAVVAKLHLELRADESKIKPLLEQQQFSITVPDNLPLQHYSMHGITFEAYLGQVHCNRPGELAYDYEVTPLVAGPTPGRCPGSLTA